MRHKTRFLGTIFNILFSTIADNISANAGNTFSRIWTRGLLNPWPTPLDHNVPNFLVTIFLTKLPKSTFWAILNNITFQVILCGLILGNFTKIWVLFNFNIWSRCVQASFLFLFLDTKLVEKGFKTWKQMKLFLQKYRLANFSIFLVKRDTSLIRHQMAVDGMVSVLPTTYNLRCIYLGNRSSNE